MDMRELHWLMHMLTHMDVGIVVFDRQGKIQVWNNFMENHSGVSSTEIKEDQSLFELFPVFKESWLQSKLDSALVLDNQVFISWEQVPHVFDFAAFRPITGGAGKMYQNITITALKDASGNATLLSLMVYDVTDIAVNKLALEKINQTLEITSRTDKLTGMNNRGYWQEKLIEAVNLNNRYQTPYSLIMFDIDHFKSVNDTYGHQAGDAVIRQVAAVAKECARINDITGRYGGEEFGLILPETDGQGAMVLAERLREAVEALEVHFDKQILKVTISLGIAEKSQELSTTDQWVEAADQALYLAKNEGRNCSRLA